MAEKEWWRTYFEENYLAFHKDRPFRDTQEELDLVQSVLGPAAGRSLLDACCGQGRHAIPLCRLGWRVTGVDQSELMLEMAQREAEGLGRDNGGIEWVRADLRRPMADSRFDAAICLFTSFGYCPEDSENQKVLESIHRALKSGGAFILDVANRDFLIQHPYAIRNWWQRGEEYILEETKLSPVTSLATTRNVLVSTEGVRESEYRIRLYSLHEIVRMMVEIGFEITSAYGNFPAEPIQMTSPRLILVTTKE
ncbi:MAG: methyltransferase domain-containing protein [Candidatus Omnitrophica bacterium]|nr:methyltransferase domain-containing protein [Candidatus Omnitrophota bacterium]